MRPYLKKGDVEGLFAQLESVLINLDFADNFQGFLWTGEIPANTEKVIANKLKGLIPRYFLVLIAEGTNQIIKGPTIWSEGYVSVKNFSSTTAATVTIYFFA